MDTPATGAAPTSAPSAPATLKDVIDAVPPRCRERSTPRALALVARSLVVYGLVVAALVAVDTWWLLVPLWVVAGWAVSGLFILGHDAAHGSFTPSARLNRWLGRILFVPSLHIHEAWVLGHNRIHHGHTVRERMDFVWHPATPEAYRAMNRRQRLLHRIEWSWAGAGLYYLRTVWWEKMIAYRNPPAKWAAAIRRDRWFLYTVVALVVTGVALLGGLASGDLVGAAWMVTKVVVMPFLAFIWTIGATVYVHHIDPAIRWHPRAKWDKVAGQLDGTTVLRIPAVLDRLFFHSIFVHMPHHVDMRIPCYHLDEAAAAIAEAFPGRVIERRLRLGDYLAATRTCKLYDFEQGRWLPYAAART